MSLFSKGKQYISNIPNSIENFLFTSNFQMPKIQSPGQLLDRTVDLAEQSANYLYRNRYPLLKRTGIAVGVGLGAGGTILGVNKMKEE